MSLNSKKVLVFGTFDGIHDGHRFFLREAKKHGDELVVVVAKDGTVKKLKGSLPKIPLPNRIKTLEDESLADRVISGDENIGSWKIVKREAPNVICLGYDQKELAVKLMKDLPDIGPNIEIAIIGDYKGDELHNSIIKKHSG
ncbi:MAG TPA: adenylyltransferase/cytidyltransferase family protein [Candidatus Paceibacterota bacterium]